MQKSRILARNADESDEAKRAQVQGHLSGELKAPTKVCVHCGGRASVKSVTIEVSWKHRGVNGTGVIPGAVCLDGCKKTTINPFKGMNGLTWCHGSQDVTVVDGPIFETKDLSLMFTRMQRERGEQFLAETAPS